MVFVSVPLGAMRSVFEAMRPGLATDAVITDGGSAKASVIADFAAACPQAMSRFVPGHPIAGTERSGVAASLEGLFRDRRVILTPLPETDAGALARVRALWEAAGAEVVTMPVERHDQVLAATSHLPHLLAYAVVDSLAGMTEHDDIFRFAAGGFRDFSRIASSDPVMWRDICLANRDALLDVVERFQADFAEFVAAIRAADGDRLHELFRRARQAREDYLHQFASTPPEDEPS